MKATKKVSRKVNDPILEAIKKAKIAMEKRNELFKKPHPVSNLKTGSSSTIYDRQSANLRENLQLKKKFQIAETSPTELMSEITEFYSVPPLLSPRLSPIKEHGNLVVNSTLKPLFQNLKKIQDSESSPDTKRIHKVFRRNLENFEYSQQEQIANADNSKAECPIHCSKTLFPPILSPIKEKKNLAINRSAKSLFKTPKKIADDNSDEMKKFIEIFATNIENLTRGINNYEQMNIPDEEDIFIDRKRRKCDEPENHFKRQKTSNY